MATFDLTIDNVTAVSDAVAAKVADLAAQRAALAQEKTTHEVAAAAAGEQVKALDRAIAAWSKGKMAADLALAALADESP